MKEKKVKVYYIKKRATQQTLRVPVRKFYSINLAKSHS